MAERDIESTSATDSHDDLLEGMRLSTSPSHRWLFLSLGHVAIVVGLIGLLIPVMPTSPCLLLAAYFYARGSQRFYVWLLTNRWCGAQIRAFRDHGVLPRTTKYAMALTLFIAFGTTILFIIPTLPWKAAVAILATIAIAFVVRIPSKI